MSLFEQHEEDRLRIFNLYLHHEENKDDMEEMELYFFEESVRQAQATLVTDYPDIYDYGGLISTPVALNLSPSDLSMEGKLVKEATIDKLVEYATLPLIQDGNFVDEFQLVFRGFLSPKELFIKILFRYNTVPSPEHFPKDKFLKWRNEHLNILRIRTTVFVKRWVERHWIDFDEEMIKYLETFIQIVKKTDLKLVDQLTWARDQSVNALRKKLIVDISKFPKQIVPEGDGLFLHNWDPVEVARQLTLYEFEIFARIAPYEFMNQRWTKKEKATEAPNITKMIQWFNKLNIYFVTHVITEFDVAKRAERMKYVFRVADECRKIRNFNGLFEICSSLAHQSIHRLKKTWEACGPGFDKKFAELQAITLPENNFKNLREVINPTQSCIPYIGVFFTDMIMIDEGNKNYIGQFVNYSKCRKIAKVLGAVHSYQHTPFEFARIPQFQGILDEISNSRDISDKDLYEMSVCLEGRSGKNSYSTSKTVTVIKSPKVSNADELSRRGSSSSLNMSFGSSSGETYKEGPPMRRGSFEELSSLDDSPSPGPSQEDVVKKGQSDTVQSVAFNLFQLEYTDDVVSKCLAITDEEVKKYRRLQVDWEVGRMEQLKTIVAKFISLDFNNDMICKATGLSSQQVEKLRKPLNLPNGK